MPIKLIIAEACSLATSEGAQHADVGQTVEVDTKEEALTLCRYGRAFFLDKTVDPTKGLLTATKEDQDRLKRQAQQIEADRKARTAEAAASVPANLSALIAAQVAAAVQAATAGKTPAAAAA
jgi:hypothetical protein